MGAGSLHDYTVVLIVDDEDQLRSFCHQVLENAGFVVLLAGDGRQALDVSRAYPNRIDLVITDINMPTMSGFALARRLLTERPGIRVVATSGDTPSTTTRLPFLEKPFTVERLLTTVREALNGPPPSLADIEVGNGGVS
jgi:two-component system cell cycle sensor histidine kinase/response regulator CckA